MLLASSMFAYSVDSEVLAHWDFADGVRGSATRAPATAPHHCFIPSSLSVNGGLGESWNTRDSEDEGVFDAANCYSNWGHSNNYLSFTVTANSLASGNITSYSFDIGNYGDINDPNQYRVEVFKNGTRIQTNTGTFQDGAVNGLNINPWNSTSGRQHGINTNGSFSEGSTDVYEFRVEALDTRKDGSEVFIGNRIAIDNFRVHGGVTCVPEPSTAFLAVLATLGFMNRRSR